MYAPLGRDAAIAAALLSEVGAHPRICPDLGGFIAALNEDACFAVVTEEALNDADLRPLAGFVAGQPAWSDLPFIVLTRSGGGPERNPAAARLSELLGNATFLERPFHPTTFASIARSALKARARQFEARMRIEQLHESEERLRTALAAGRLGSWELDMANGTLDISAAGKAVFGFPPEAALDFSAMLAAIHPQDRPAMVAVVDAALHAGTDFTLEYRTVWPDGGLHWAEVRARSVRDRRGVRLVGVCSDITDRRAAEDAMLRLNETLEERVAERTAALKQAHDAMLAEIGQREHAEELLRQAQKMEAVGQLTGGLAHDFNNLLAGISGNLELLAARARQGRIGELDRFITAAQAAAARAASLTHRLLAFSRRQTLDPKPTALNRLVAGMEELIARTVGPGIALETAGGEGLWNTLVDPNQLENALLNLCINARDAMPDGGSLRITTANRHLDAAEAALLELPPGAFVTLCVQDTGTGMTPEVMARAFDPFFTTKPVGAGTGLGLSMIYGFARQSGGQAHIESAPGQGTRICLFLPRHDGAVDDAALAAVPPAPPAQAGETVLVVDDEASVRMLVAEVLQDLGYAAIEAVDGPSGLAVLRSDARIDLMISDVGLPGGMNGRQLADAGRSLRPDLRVLFITGYAESAVMSQPAPGVRPDPGMQVMTKPFTLDALGARIRELINAPRRAAG